LSVDKASERPARERDFWNERVRHDAAEALLTDYRVGPEDRCDRAIPWLPYIGMPAYVDRVIAELGDISGRAVLDIGAGTGFMTALLAARGADVDAVDVAEESLARCAMRVRLSGVSSAVRLHCMAGERLAFPNCRFDRVVGVFVLHHLDLTAALAEIHRVLRPGGIAIFIETWGRNPILMLARRLLTGHFGIDKAGSDDEQPLGWAARRLLARGPFVEVRYLFPELLFWRMLGYVPLARGPAARAAWRAADLTLGKLAVLRTFSYFCVVVLRKR
jgi:SAM-dependent methyltransferase